jgi:methylated-DNA-protein-cysteine methyltransferase related protein
VRQVRKTRENGKKKRVASVSSVRAAKKRKKRKPAAKEADSGWQRFYDAVRKVPRGKVATYGQIAEVAGLPGYARQVGYALAAIGRNTTVPWQRVINAQGRVSVRSSGPGSTIVQQQALEREGVIFDAGGRVSLKRYGWKPRGRGGAESVD